MKYLALLLIFGFGLSSFGQTIKTLGFNSTNGQVVANTGTNVLTFTNDVKFGGGELSIETQNISGGNVSFSFEDGLFGGPLVIASNSTITFLGNVAATTRTNLGLGWSALTNTNAATTLLGYDTNGQVVYDGTNVLTFTNNETQFFSITLQEPSVSPITLDPSGGSLYVYDDAEFVISFGDGSIAAGAPITFADINGVYDATIAAATRANLGFYTNLNTLWTASNASNARSAVGLGVTDSVTFSNVMVGSLSGVAGGFVGFDTSGQLTLRGTNLTASVPAFFGYDGFNVTAMSPSSSRLRLGFSTNLNTLWTATNASNAKSAVGLGVSDSPRFDTVYLGGTNTYIGGNGIFYDGQGSGGGISMGIIAGQGVQNVTIGRFDNLFTVFSNSLFFNGSQSWGANTTNQAITRTNLGLGGGITTNRTFVSYNGTNYTTNTVTISNGIITGWTQ